MTPADPAGLLRQVLASQRSRVLGAGACLMSWQACEALVPVSIGAVIQQAISTHDGGVMLGWLVVLAGQFLVLSLSYRFGARLGRGAAERCAHDLRVRLSAAVLDPGRLPDPSHRPGVTVAVAGSDADRVGDFCGLYPRTAGAVVSVLIAAVALLRISVPLGLLVLIGAPAMLVLIHVLGAPLERRSSEEQEHAADAVSLATDLMHGLRVLRGIHGEGAAAERYRQASQRSREATVRAARAESAYDAATSGATMLFLALIALVGGRIAARGDIGVGDLVAAVGLAQFLIGPLTALSYVGASRARARASAGRVLQVLRAARRERAGVDLPASAATLEVTPPGVRVATGELVGLVAAAPEAAEILARLSEASYSSTGVYLAGIDPSVADLEQVTRRLLVDRHDHQLFAVSVLDNVRADATDELDVTAAIDASGTSQVAETLPEGLDTVVGERGQLLSGGQRQRVALARALAADPPVLVLHDPTTAVDAVTEARIAGRLREARHGRSTLVVATSPALLAQCDRVLHVVDGAVVAEGTHAALIADSAHYRERVIG